jgi:Na+/serine symporter
MTLAVLANLVVFALAIAWLARRAKNGAALSNNVLVALLLGVALGGLAQAIYGLGGPAITQSVPWLNVVGTGYVRLLQMIIAPLVLISILAAVTRLNDAKSLGAISALVLGLLLITTAISTLIGVGVSTMFGLRADSIVQGARELERGTALQARVGEAANLTIPSLLQSFIPTNIFADLAGTRSTSVIGIVIFAVLLGFAILALRREKPEVGERIMTGLDTLQQLVMRLVRLVIRLTPYGVLALMARIVATSNIEDVMNLGRFVVARDGWAEPAAFLSEDLARPDVCVHLALERGGDSAQRRNPGLAPWRRAGDCELRSQLWRNDRPERVCGTLSGDARGDDCADGRDRSHLSRLHHLAGGGRNARIGRDRRRRRRSNVRGARGPVVVEPPGRACWPIDFRGTSHRHGPDRGERQRIDDGWDGYQPRAASDGHGFVRRDRDRHRRGVDGR